MRFILFCLLVFTGLISKSFAQQLVLKDTLKGRERKFTAGKSFLYMTLQNPEYTKGKIIEIQDTAIVFYLVEEEVPVERTVSVKDISVIRKATKIQYYSYAIGGILLLNGAYFTIEGPTLKNRGIGVLSFVAGLVPFFFTPKTYELGGRFVLLTRKTDSDVLEPGNKE